jgi:hypothetical protein
VIEDAINDALTPRKAKIRSDLPVHERLYAIHEEKLVGKVFFFFFFFYENIV